MRRKTRFESRVKFSDRKTENWIPKPEFCVAHRNILTLFWHLVRTISLDENELGDSEDCRSLRHTPRSVHTEFERRPQNAVSGLSSRL